MKRELYRVHWSGECYVWAEDERDAERVALTEIGQARADEMGIDVMGIKEDGNHPPDSSWSDSLPYGDPPGRWDHYLTVAEILEAMPRRKARREKRSRKAGGPGGAAHPDNDPSPKEKP
jgi:hypothetical protein